MAKRPQKSSRKSRNLITPPPQQYCPALSVIIPLYNTEKYIGECLDSLLAQTFKNYEVIVVDDCSTDNSAAIVETYIPKFGGRLKLSRTDSNTGSGAMPRNKGMMLSRGEYIFFMDADDLFTQTALEELYSLAKDYDADVVYCEKYYKKVGSSSDISESYWQQGGFVDKPTLETEDLAERVQRIVQKQYSLEPWNNLVKRELIVDNDISFPHLKVFEDEIWTYNLVFNAKRYLRVPCPLCIHRFHDSSNTSAQKPPPDSVKFWISPVIDGIKFLDRIMNTNDFFVQNPQYRYAVLEHFAADKFNIILLKSLQLPPFEIYKAIKQEFGDKLGEQDVLVSALCTLVNTQQKMFVVNQQRFNQFAAQAQQRIAELEAQLKTK